MDDRSVMLELPSHADLVLKELLAMQKGQQLCDVRLTTSAGGISVHRLVVISTSPYLKSRLSVEVTNTMEIVHFDNISISLIETVVQFMYTGKLMFETSNVDQLLKFCEDLELATAVDLLKNYIKDILPSASNESKSDSNEEKSNKKILESKSPNETLNDKSEKPTLGARRSNRRVKQTPKKRAAVEAAMSVQEKIPDKVSKLSSDMPVGKKSAENTTAEKTIITRARKMNKNANKSKASSSKGTKAGITKVNTLKSSRHANKKLGKAKPYDAPKAKTKTEDDRKREGNIETVKNKLTKKKDSIVTAAAESNKLHNEIKEPETEAEIMDDEKVELKSSTAETDNLTEEKKGKKLFKRGYIKVKKVKAFPCSICDKILTTNKRLVFHEFCQHGIDYDKTKYKMVPCPVEGCGYISANQNNLQTHINSRHNSERPHICEFCGKAFKLQSVLATHLNIHTGARVFECKHCGERFNQHAGLDVHIKRHHMGEASWGELCHLCSEKFLQKSELCWHLFRTHNQPLPDKYKAYICDICNYLTKSSQDLERHKNAHNGIKQFVCSICQKSCTTKSELKRHVKYHGEKTYKCTFEGCTYACVDAPGLRKHIQLMHTHKNYKPYICSVCKYKTGVKGNLDKHIRQVHNLEVVTKHTVNLKMKYKNFETGDIITKDGQLVVSAQDRKLLQQQELTIEGTSLEGRVEVDAEVDTSVGSLIICGNTLTEQTGSNTNAESDLIIHPVAAEKYQDTQGNVYSSPEPVQITSVEPVSSQGRLLGSYIYSQSPTVTSHMPLGFGAQDLRMGLSTHLANPQLYQEVIQRYVTDTSVENVEIVNKVDYI